MIKMSRKAKKAMAVALTAGMLASTATTPVMAAGEGWKSNATGWWYENADGTYPASKWQKIGEKWYYFNANGYMVSGWQSINGNWYYFGGANDGAMKDGWFKDYTGKWCFAETGNGAIYVNQWAKSGNTWYFLDANGYMQEGGWVNDAKSGAWYFVNKAGEMQTGVVKVEDKVYYLDKSGAMAVGEKTINGEVYKFDATGAATGDKIPTPEKAFKTDGTSVALDPEEKELSVVGVASFTKNDKGDFVVTVLLNKEVTAETLKDTSLTLTNGSLVAKTQFDSVNGANAVYKVTNPSVLTPGDSSADGTYTVTATGLDVATGLTASYAETVVSNAVQGIVYYDDTTGNGYTPVKNAKVSIGNKEVTTDANGYYSIYSDPGSVNVKVTADGYFEGQASVVVNRNYTTAQNIKLDVYNKEKLSIVGIVVDEKTSNTVSGAKVELKKLNTTTNEYETVADVKTDNTGRFLFENKTASSDFTSNSASKKTFNDNKLSEKDTYKVVITKAYNADLPTNISNAYHEKEYAVTMNQYAAQTNLNTKTIKPVEALNSVALTMNWDGATSVANGNVDLDVTFMDTDGKTPLGNSTVEVKVDSKKMVDANNIITSVFTSAPTLPSGTYALVVKDTTTPAVATKVIVLKVEEGKNLTVTDEFEVAQEGGITTSIQKKYITELKTVFDDSSAGAKDVETLNTAGSAVNSGDKVQIQYKVYQKTPEGRVLIDTATAADFKYSYAIENDSDSALEIKASSSILNLDASKEYECEPISNYTTSNVITLSDAESFDRGHEVKSAAVIEKIKLDNVSFVESDGTTPANVDSTKILSIKIKDANGNVKAEVKKPKDGVTYNITDVNGIEISASNFDDADNFKRIPAGKYYAEVTVDGFEPFTTTTFDLLDLQKKTVSTTDANTTVKKVAKTTVYGAIRYEDGTEATGDASIVVFDSNGIVVAAKDGVLDDLDGNLYSIVDGTEKAKLSAGTYTVVVRGEYFETTPVEIQLEANKSTQKDIIVTKHTGAVAKLTVRDTNNFGYGETAGETNIKLQDKFYVAKTDKVRDPDGILTNANLTNGVTGEYDVTSVDSSDVEFKTNAELSKGQYTIVIPGIEGEVIGNSSKDVININNINGTSQANIVLTAVQSAKTVNLTVLFPGISENTKSWVIVEDVNGTVIAIDDDFKDNALPNDNTAGKVTFKVSANGTYIVKVYSDGQYVGSNKVTVQDNNEKVTVVVEAAIQ